MCIKTKTAIVSFSIGKDLAAFFSFLASQQNCVCSMCAFDVFEEGGRKEGKRCMEMDVVLDASVAVRVGACLSEYGC